MILIDQKKKSTKAAIMVLKSNFEIFYDEPNLDLVAGAGFEPATFGL